MLTDFKYQIQSWDYMYNAVESKPTIDERVVSCTNVITIK